MSPVDSFNKASGADAATDARAKLLEAITAARANLALAEAAQRRDWTEAARLCDQGANPEHRDDAALKALTDSDEIAVADIMAKLPPIGYRPAISYTLSAAAEKGNLGTIAHILAMQPEAGVLNLGLCRALLSKQDAAADMLLKAIPEAGLTDNALFGLLVARPAEYERITGLPELRPDYLMHFINACHFREKAATGRAYEKLLANKDDVMQRIALSDMMDGSLMGDLATQVFSSGDTGIIDRFIGDFRGDLMPDYLLLHVALRASEAEPGIFPHIVEKLGIKPEMMGILMMHGSVKDRRPGARFLMDFAPEAAKEAAFPLLRVFAGGDTPEEFFAALDKGIPLPQEEKKLVSLLEAAIEAKNEGVARHIEAAIGTFTAAHLAEMQSSGSTDVMLRAAQLSGDWHARGEALFWRAASEGRRDILEAMPDRQEKLSAVLPYQLDFALSGAIARDDEALLREIVDRTPWDDDTRKKAADRLIGAPQWLPLLGEIGHPPRPLIGDDAHAIVRGDGVKAVNWLTAHGFTLDDGAATAIVEIAARENKRETLEFMLGRGARLEDAARLATMIDYYADQETLGLLEKWLRREERRPVPDMAARVAQAAPDQVFALAVEAAYGDALGVVLNKAAEANPSFDPAVLAQTRDAFGNSILDVLGAHGRLNDILVPGLWRDRDAVAFVRDNTPPCYHGQCDFNGLKAALDQLRLKELGKRLRVGLKGP